MYDVLSLPEIRFPAGFLWGSSTAAYQNEGDNLNSDFYRAELEGKFSDPCGKACNGYALYKEDIELVRRLGHQAFRFGPEWSRVEPTQGEFNAEATDHYVDACRRLAEAGIQPWITLHHFSNPIWFAKMGEWHQRENIDAFLKFVEYIVPKFAPYVAGWLPINEYNLHGGSPPPPENHAKMAKYKFHLLLADAMTYDIIKSHSKAEVASPIAYLPLQASRPYDTFDKAMSDYADWVCQGYYYHAMRTGEYVYPFTDGGYYPQLKGRCDFWAVNMYVREMIDSRKANARGLRYPHKAMSLIQGDDRFTQSEFSPDQLMWNLERLTDKPVRITENGLACVDDRFRVAYLASHLAAYRQAIDHGVDLRGYFVWTLMDNWEWGSYKPKLGLVECDHKTFKRTPRPSAWFYKDVIAANGLSGAMVRKYLDRLPSLADGRTEGK